MRKQSDPTFHYVYRVIDRARHRVPLALRLMLWGHATYRCSPASMEVDEAHLGCGVEQGVYVGYGVGRGRDSLALPGSISCTACGGEAALVGDVEELSSPRPVTTSTTYLRVPSRRAAVEGARAGSADAQVVFPASMTRDA